MSEDSPRFFLPDGSPNPRDRYFRSYRAFLQLFPEKADGRKASLTLSEAGWYMPEARDTDGYPPDNMLEFYLETGVITPGVLPCGSCQILAEPYRLFGLLQHAMVRAILEECLMADKEGSGALDTAHYNLASDLLSLLGRINSAKTSLADLYLDGALPGVQCCHERGLVFPSQDLLRGYDEDPYHAVFDVYMTKEWSDRQFTPPEGLRPPYPPRTGEASSNSADS